MDQTEQFLKALTEAHGVPGYETEVRAGLRQYMSPLGDVSQDKLGSLVGHQPGQGPKVMLAGHMDEIGFVVTYVSDEGFIKFLPLGGWWDQTLLSQRVIVKTHKGDVVGVVGAKPPHLLSADERSNLDRFAKRAGLMFQVVDDILDCTASTATLGKTAGKDDAAEKPTYVRLLGLDAARDYAEELRADALAALVIFGERAARLSELADVICHRQF